ncbi:ABC transporter ATP-binding protein [Pseudomonas sp. NFACC05-1]|uniref:ATP-binding cassette domain-containing protein n=1 Tax=Pseudomonas sp. NFACC05-1 TaxID=1566241 RepID=UPI000871A06B|nr:ABC transporter ATP-binding protein [Pseudomonas sp. NFACC05-1]SCW91938.1 AAA domain-containing protein [Pseudomonas sp. NFACC05-1]
MRIESIYVENFQGLRSANLDLTTAPITMVCGLNGAGKSSLKEAIGLALGEAARVKLKGDYKLLITEGEKKAQIIIGHDGVASSITLPKGTLERNDIAGQEYLPYVLNPEAFANLDDKARRSLLFALTKSSGKPAVVVEKLVARGCDAAKVEKIKPLLLSGFPAAMEQAKTYTSESRGAWKAITGEAYGSEKAEGWVVSIDPLPEGTPEVTQDDLAQAQAEQAKAAAEIEKGNQYLGNLNAKREAITNVATRKAELEPVYLEFNRRKNKLEATNKELEAWRAKVSEAEQHAQAFSGESPCECPSCGVKLKIVGKVIELFKGKSADAAKLVAAQAELKKANDAYNLMARTQVNDQKAVDESIRAGNDLEALVKSAGEDVPDAKIAEAEAAIQGQRNLRDKAKAKAELMAERLDLIANAKNRGAEAAKHHQDVKDWTLITNALAPDGIPGEILAGALEPINASLVKLSATAGWPVVKIGADMAITANGRLYTLLSESERWRCDALIALTIAIASGLNLVLMDRFDVLITAARSQLLALLRSVAKSNGIQSIICGSLKEKPTTLPADFNAIWIENGTAGGDVQLQKAS